VPLVLQTREYVDFSNTAEYDISIRHLEESIRNRRDIIEANAVRTAYNNSPPVPQNFVDRPAVVASLRDTLFAEAANRNIAVTAIEGMAGIGKTVLARALCQLEVMRHAYPDGIFWLTIGRESNSRFCQLIEQVPGLKVLVGSYSNDEACVSQYRNAFRTKAVLIVLDDVWRVQDMERFLTESPRSRLLITTRDADIAPAIGAREFVAELPTGDEASEILARWAGLDPGALSPQALEVIERCQSLPLGLAMIGAHLRGKSIAHWDAVLDHLRNADLSSIRARFPEPHTSLMGAMHLSFEALRRKIQFPLNAVLH
jgi:hypothetical protein